MGRRTSTYVRFLTTFVTLGAIGLAATIYVLVNQRVTLPFENVYSINAEFSAADGVVSGIGQPVNVVGVTVGQITAVKRAGSVALVTLQLNANRLPHVYANATASLSPITPLDDMEINLEPGRPPAAPLTPGATIDIAQTTSPVQLSELLSTLNANTRDYLASLLSSVSEGTSNRGLAIRQMLQALGPTTSQLGAISRALAQRRTALAAFVHDLAAVTRAASQDGQLASVVQAGNQTLTALAAQDAPLRAAVAQLPATLDRARSTLVNLQPFANRLGPTLTALEPAVRRLPQTLRALEPFDAVATPVLRDSVRPLVRAAQPLLSTAGPAVSQLNRATPSLTGSAQTLNYVLNELSYVPGGQDQGFLYWLAWAGHNIDSELSTGDANGAIARAIAVTDCSGITTQAKIQSLLGVVGLCPK